MISANDKRRAAKGCTHEPYECCGKEPESGYGRRKGQICGECRSLIEDGRRFRSEKKQQELEVFGWTSRDYAFPGYYGDYDFGYENGRDVRDDLEKALFELVNVVAIDAPGDTPRQSPAYEMRKYVGHGPQRHHLPWPYVLTVPPHNHDSWSWGRLVLINPAIRNAIDKLDQKIRAALTHAYNSGKQNGGSILRQLASGDMSLTDFEDGLVPREERERRRSRS